MLGKSAPSRLMVRVQAEVPLRCMPRTRIAVRPFVSDMILGLDGLFTLAGLVERGEGIERGLRAAMGRVRKERDNII